MSKKMLTIHFDGYVKSWTIGLSPNVKLVNTMLKGTMKSYTKMKNQSFIAIEKHTIAGQNGKTYGRKFTGKINV